MREPSGDLATGNNLYNPKSGDYTLTTVNNLYFNRYNNIVFATNYRRRRRPGPEQVRHAASWLHPADAWLPQPIPAGRLLPRPTAAATAATTRAAGSGGLIQPRVLGGMYQEIYTAYDVPVETGPRKYAARRRRRQDRLAPHLRPAAGLAGRCRGGRHPFGQLCGLHFHPHRLRPALAADQGLPPFGGLPAHRLATARTSLTWAARTGRPGPTRTG